MRVDREDRYLSEQPNKSAILSKLPSLLQEFFKKKLAILGMAVVIILLLLSWLLFPVSNKNEPTLLTPPEINGVATSQVSNDALTQGQAALTKTSSGENIVLDEQFRQLDNQQRPEVKHNPVTPLSHPNINGASGLNNVKTNANSTKASINKDAVDKINHHKPHEKLGLENNLKLGDNSYSIQLTASKSADGLKKFVEHHKITNYQIYETQRNNEKWYILIKGNYSSSEEAHKAIKSLPSALQKNKPWVKSSATINKEKASK
ncbi:SPOR domain-containing protein [Gilliamella sp. App4-10]|uniref:SPOR domain-containing protein n=1 Tax=Gilliamella sp. App4-10 TaxID=3120231 RepID=UPI00080E8DCC|nr:SPOR domain-containing protein [Gilliamella apicola]OCG21263.1 hypothetical protein A9G23_05215 [Gilliamella apicola]